MRLLVIDTALGACTAAVFEDARPLAAQFLPMTKGHQERLGGVVRDVVAEAGGGFDALERIGVTVGPGSFTGLRVGLAFAQGLGAALDALAGSLPKDGSPVAALIDARRGQVYAKLFVDGVATGPDEALTLEDAARRIAALGPDVRLVGNGAAVLTEAFPDLKHALIDDRVAPSPEALALLTAAADPVMHLPKPLYLRAPDATPPSRLPGQPRQPAVPTAT